METKRIFFQKNSETPCVVKATVALFDLSPQGSTSQRASEFL
jgi:hypothetical protein